ncbi:MAG TPA: hypothetical protein PKD72_03270, partial [Gemmatales bacterium]|nr:hypothetical protein [Gemmatales bacterium]
MKWIWLLMLWPITGCLQLLQTPVVEAPCLPGRQQYRHGCLVIHDDTGVHRNHPLFAELAHFPEEVCRVLKLPVQDGLIHVYLFPDQTSFDTYLLAFYPEVTKRRALFIKRPSAVLGGQEELQILCFWGDDIAAQLRHELTHATLHGLRLRLPLWL